MTAHPSNGRDDPDAIAACVSRHPAAQTPHEERVADDILGVDPECRYLGDPVRYPLHECRRNTGELVRPGEQCWYESRAQLDEQNLVCLACGDRIAPTGPRGAVTTDHGRTYRFHGGDCFLRADDAIAAHEHLHPACGYCGAELTRIDLPSQRWCHTNPNTGCRMSFPTTTPGTSTGTAVREALRR